MARRRAPAAQNTGPVVPPDLYYGIAPGAFHYLGPDRPSPDVSRHAAWTQAVRDAGWTISAVREAAAKDVAYLAWSRAQRRQRLIQNDPGRAPDHDDTSTT